MRCEAIDAGRSECLESLAHYRIAQIEVELASRLRGVAIETHRGEFIHRGNHAEVGPGNGAKAELGGEV
jgi:hypothetical protein